MDEGYSTEVRNAVSKEDARKRRDEVIAEAFEERYPVLIDALPSVGKSYGIVRWAAETGNPVSVFTARRDLYRQYKKWSDEFGLQVAILPSFHRDCETANGKFGSAWSERVQQKYNSGLTPNEIHRRASTLFGKTLPCTRDRECAYQRQRPTSLDEINILVGHYKHAHVPSRIKGRFVVFDEFPKGDFLREFDSTTANGIVSDYLRQQEDLPYQYAKQLRGLDAEGREAVNKWFSRNNPKVTRDVGALLQSRSTKSHADAPTLLYAYVNFRELENTWEYANIPGGRVAIRSPSDETLSLLTPPYLSGAESVIALDGTPIIEKWSLLLGDDLKMKQVHTDTEKSSYIRDGLGIRVIQTTPHAKPYSRKRGTNVTPAKDLTLIEAIGRKHSQLPGLITTLAASRQYEQYLKDVDGVTLNDLTQKYVNYARIKGSNEFKSCRLGAIAGSPHYGNDVIEKWAALLGESVRHREDTHGMNQDFGEVGNLFLRDMREHEVLQAILRFGRDGGGATVYVHTAAIPEWLSVDMQIPEVHSWSKGTYELFEAFNIVEGTAWTPKELAENMSISIQMVRKHLNRLVEYGYLRREKDEQDKRRILYIAQSLDEIGKLGHVKFSRV